eukprot:2029625-Prymnesium_polylepis.2
MTRAGAWPLMRPKAVLAALDPALLQPRGEMSPDLFGVSSRHMLKLGWEPHSRGADRASPETPRHAQRTERYSSSCQLLWHDIRPQAAHRVSRRDLISELMLVSVRRTRRVEREARPSAPLALDHAHKMRRHDELGLPLVHRLVGFALGLEGELERRHHEHARALALAKDSEAGAPCR